MKKFLKIVRREPGWGQSLVETALFLPILIVMLAGLVEVGNLLITQNRVTTASRMSTGFGAANYDRESFVDVTAVDMGVVALNTVTETMDLAPEKWDIWSIRASVSEGVTVTTPITDFFEYFDSVHAYGSYQVVTDAEWNNELEPQVKEDMKNDLLTWPEGISELEVVSSIPFNDVETILGLPIWQWTGVRSIRAMTVMRVKHNTIHNTELAANTCPILPITVRLDQFSLYPQNWIDQQEAHLENGGDYFVLGDQVTGDFPDELPSEGTKNWNYPDDPFLEYLNGAVAEKYGFDPLIADNVFKENKPGIRLSHAITNEAIFQGNIYWSREDASSGNYGWYSWRDVPGEILLRESLTAPGNFWEDDVGYAGSPVDLNDPQYDNDLPEGVQTAGGVKPGKLEPGEWLDVKPGNPGRQEQRILESYIISKAPVVLVVYDITNEELFCELGDCDRQPGDNTLYRTHSFITVRLLGFKFVGPPRDVEPRRYLVFRFIDANPTCEN